SDRAAHARCARLDDSDVRPFRPADDPQGPHGRSRGAVRMSDPTPSVLASSRSRLATREFPQQEELRKRRLLGARMEGLNHSHGHGELAKQVLFDNYLEVTRGEIVIMTGPSGSGKTSLLTLIGGLRTIQDGSVQVLGREMFGLSAEKLVEVR